MAVESFTGAGQVGPGRTFILDDARHRRLLRLDLLSSGSTRSLGRRPAALASGPLLAAVFFATAFFLVVFLATVFLADVFFVAVFFATTLGRFLRMVPVLVAASTAAGADSGVDCEGSPSET